MSDFEKTINILEDRKAKLLKEIRTRNQKIKELEIELRVYQKIKQQGAGVTHD